MTNVESIAEELRSSGAELDSFFARAERINLPPLFSPFSAPFSLNKSKASENNVKGFIYKAARY